jgi:hypothetical protein
MSDKELPARLAIESQYARLSEAVRNKDLDALRALHTSEYRELQITGEERDLAEVMAEWRGDLAVVIEPSFQTEIHNFDLDGDVANVTVSSVQAFISSPSASQRFGNRIGAQAGRDHAHDGRSSCPERDEGMADSFHAIVIHSVLSICMVATVVLRVPAPSRGQQLTNLPRLLPPFRCLLHGKNDVKLNAPA